MRDTDAPVILRRDLLEKKSHGEGQISLEQRYVPPADPDEADPHAAWDLMVAKAITRVLLGAYSGHFWAVEVSRKQGIATITIPILLGNWKYKFSLSEDIQPRHIIRAGGEILERFNIPRTNLDLPAFLAAKKNAVSRASDKLPT